MIRESLEWVALAADGVAVVVILIGFALAVGKFVVAMPRAIAPDAILGVAKIRCLLGAYLVFGLELMIVSDLLHSVLSRNIEDLYFLGAIVVLRTVIAYFLSQEIQELREARV